MSDAIALVAKPHLSDELKAECVKLLRDALAEAEKGEVCAVVVLMERVDGSWSNDRSGTMSVSAMVGRLEITKHELIANYLRE